ncbi:hypothetical protein MPTK1_7g05110 [Marchantia polymorpha subsp. ruderalis]|uniref:Uncharacterized protein n=2 Tax=Marchantia polymorpha TaxID=3197 RepID=A0AAF6BWA9_MARPO|nr:hypothetical protein MARPO_0062s0014 [Marchantia polymorpha]BBN16293.1 hypothetical protein Mp_7g05110 [Marchantia polymorpha subsp. ruderalis]|eukprot:PTQ36588.1 hypothetical protein MARPO_0062s0014 [Marchantia polymorpha]
MHTNRHKRLTRSFIHARISHPSAFFALCGCFIISYPCVLPVPSHSHDGNGNPVCLPKGACSRFSVRGSNILDTARHPSMINLLPSQDSSPFTCTRHKENGNDECFPSSR